MLYIENRLIIDEFKYTATYCDYFAFNCHVFDLFLL
jgi:hypothetical protein